MPYKNLEISGPNPVIHQPRQVNQFYRGFSSVNNTDSANRLYDFDLVKQDIINHFNTRLGERVMNPTFGTIVWDLIMEPLTPETKNFLAEEIQKICNYDPRVTPTQIDITEYDRGFILELTLVLNSTNQSANLKLTFDQQIGLNVQ
jgi:phage baseplate assembly protein W